MLAKTELLDRICSTMQIIGLLLIVFQAFLQIRKRTETLKNLSFLAIIIGIGGFASTVRIFLPLERTQTLLLYVSAFCGLVVILAECLYLYLESHRWKQ